MREQTPRYATLLYDVRKKLGISWSEYVYADMVHKLSYQRWCTKSLQNCADDLGVNRRQIIRMKNKLESLGYLEKNTHGHSRVTPKYTEVAVTKSHQYADQVVTKVHKVVTKSHPASDNMSLKENNRRITENKEIVKNGEGYKKAKAIANRLKANMTLSKGSV